MTIRQEMLEAAGRAPALLRERRGRVGRFVRGKLAAGGGFQDRRGSDDLYYTVFGIESLLALGEVLPSDRIEGYLRRFGAGEGLDLVHLACLARCRAACPPAGGGEEARREMLDRIEGCRAADGGYAGSPEADRGSAYACFLAIGAYQDLAAAVPDESRLAECLMSLRTQDGAFANEPGAATGLTPATAAAVTALRHLGRDAGPAADEWLLARCDQSRRDESGGFSAAPAVPMPDLLSTSTALHALAGTGAAVDRVRSHCIRFVESLWSDEGGFRAHWADEVADCEYTFYGLLALGHLSGTSRASLNRVR